MRYKNKEYTLIEKPFKSGSETIAYVEDEYGTPHKAVIDTDGTIKSIKKLKG